MWVCMVRVSNEKLWYVVWIVFMCCVGGGSVWVVWVSGVGVGEVL